MTIIYYISVFKITGITFLGFGLFFLVLWLVYKLIKGIGKNAKAFKKGYNNTLPLTENETLLKNIAQLKGVDFETQEKLKFGEKRKGSNYQAIRQEWKAIIQQNQYDIKRQYERGIITDWNECKQKMENDYAFEDDIYNLLVTWLKRIDWSDLEEVKALYKYTELVSNNDYRLNPKVLSKYHKTILTQIKKLIQKENFVIVSKLYPTTLGSLVNNLINLYFHHPTAKENTKEIAQLIPSFIKAFPDEFLVNLTYSILEKNTDNIEDTYADLLHYFISNKTEHIYDFSSSLYGKDKRPSNVVYKKSTKILKKTLQAHTYTSSEIDYLIENILFDRLDINSLAFKEHYLTKHINKLKLYKTEVHIVEKQEKNLVNLKNNFKEDYTKNWAKAVARVATSNTIFNSIELLIKHYPEHPKTKTLVQLIKEAKTFKNKPKTYNLNQKPTVKFKDLHFKYLVIEELMYNQEVLHPKFDVRVFSKEYIEREIDVEDDGYAVIPEVKKYFKNLDIPKELLEKVTTLYQDSGFGGGSEFIYELFPFWDPGCGDEVFKVSTKMLDDISLLPNLKKIIGIENSEPTKQLINKLKTMGITLEEEEKY